MEIDVVYRSAEAFQRAYGLRSGVHIGAFLPTSMSASADRGGFQQLGAAVGCSMMGDFEQMNSATSAPAEPARSAPVTAAAETQDSGMKISATC
ncbi:hypothetical protein LTH96_06025 [Nesterenkonia sp. LB17]|nr:hypothetical protein [Nesterenkonia sp. LB17]MCH8565279.1 hypothetical protein [Nesterenkonia sp. LB17]